MDNGQQVLAKQNFLTKAFLKSIIRSTPYSAQSHYKKEIHAMTDTSLQENTSTYLIFHKARLVLFCFVFVFSGDCME